MRRASCPSAAAGRRRPSTAHRDSLSRWAASQLLGACLRWGLDCQLRRYVSRRFIRFPRLTLICFYVAAQSSVIGRGSLSFASSCLETAFAEARAMDRLQLQSTPCLGWILLPEVQQFVSSYAEEFVREIAGQVRQETWAPVAPKYFSVVMPGLNRASGPGAGRPAGGSDKQQQPSVSQSFDWVASVLNHFCGTIFCLLLLIHIYQP